MQGDCLGEYCSHAAGNKGLLDWIGGSADGERTMDKTRGHAGRPRDGLGKGMVRKMAIQ